MGLDLNIKKKKKNLGSDVSNFHLINFKNLNFFDTNLKGLLHMFYSATLLLQNC